MISLRRLYRATRKPLVVSFAVLMFVDSLMPWQRPEPVAPVKPAPELETEVDDAAKEKMTPAGTPPPMPISLPSPPKALCPSGMAHVRGEYCPELAHNCKHYLDQEKDRCGDFFHTSRCLGPSYERTFCIDEYEYPNKQGTKPTLGIDWETANQLCLAEDKRLCTADEWTLACEGHGRLPYPYGYDRDSEACNIDKPYILPNDSAYANRATREEEIARLDQREPSGSRPSCVSTFGVFDMTGNVDEWVFYEKGSSNHPPYKSGLKGGYWGPVRNRCRPITATHNPWHTGYQIGLRCCRDADVADASEAPPG